MRSIDQGFEFLGYTFRRDGDHVDIAPTARNIQKFTDRVRRLLAGNRTEDARNAINSWIDAFREWSGAETMRQQLLDLTTA